MITDKTTDPSKSLSPLSELTDDYQNSKITNSSEFSMNEKLFLGKSVFQAVHNVNTTIANELIGNNFNTYIQHLITPNYFQKLVMFMII